MHVKEQLAATFDAYRNEPDVFQQMLELAREGIENHRATINAACSGNETAVVEGDALIDALHRLTNIIAALRLQTISNRLNAIERTARAGERDRTCGEWNALKDTFDEIERMVRTELESRES